MNLEKLKFPIGTRNYDPLSASKMKTTWIEQIKSLPQKLENVTQGLDKKKFSLTYRPDGWTIAQVIHHLADSHMHAYTRTKFALTQNHPNIAGYDEVSWANLKDAKSEDIKPSIYLLKGLHERWAQTWDMMSSLDFERKYYHLSYDKDFDLMNVLSLYAWHSEHHLAHIHQALKYNGELI